MGAPIEIRFTLAIIRQYLHLRVHHHTNII
jgi:hypothetical protein